MRPLVSKWKYIELSKAPDEILTNRKEPEKVKRILIIDDDPSIQLLYEEELSEEGYDVISSDGEKDVLQLIDAKRPDIILLDLILGSRSGLSLLRDIRNTFHAIPLIVTTAYPTFKIDPKSVDADAYVTKGSDLTGLKQQIEKCLAPSGPLYEKGVAPGKSAQTKDMGPAMRFHK